MNKRETTAPVARRLGKRLLLLSALAFALLTCLVLPVLWKAEERALCSRLWEGAALAGDGESWEKLVATIPSLGLHRLAEGAEEWMALSLAGVDSWPEEVPGEVTVALEDGVKFLRPVVVGGKTTCFLGRPTGDGGWLVLLADRGELVGVLLPQVLGSGCILLGCWMILITGGRQLLRQELAPLAGLTQEAGALMEGHGSVNQEPGMELREGELEGLAKGLAQLGAALALEDKLLAKSLDCIGKGKPFTQDMAQWGKLLPQAAKAAEALSRKRVEQKEGDGRDARQLEERRRKVEESTKVLTQLSTEQAAGLLRLTMLLQGAAGSSGGIGALPRMVGEARDKVSGGAMSGGTGKISNVAPGESSMSRGTTGKTPSPVSGEAPTGTMGRAVNQVSGGPAGLFSGARGAQGDALMESRRLLGQARLLSAQTAKNTVLVGALFRSMAQPGYQVTAGGGLPMSTGSGETPVLGSSLSYRQEKLP